mmetsp:Transcript_45281/g.94989  ORF Transcript_45281/g.94989 Transcript_45281/m.94989 type:complete len:86 (+) Transcript_45281:1047-1304(+)
MEEEAGDLEFDWYRGGNVGSVLYGDENGAQETHRGDTLVGQVETGGREPTTFVGQTKERRREYVDYARGVFLRRRNLRFGQAIIL